MRLSRQQRRARNNRAVDIMDFLTKVFVEFVTHLNRRTDICIMRFKKFVDCLLLLISCTFVDHVNSLSGGF